MNFFTLKFFHVKPLSGRKFLIFAKMSTFGQLSGSQVLTFSTRNLNEKFSQYILGKVKNFSVSHLGDISR